MDKYKRAQERINAGAWVSDPELGAVFNARGKQLGSKTSGGYVFLSMSPGESRSNQNVYAHRVIWEAEHGPIADGLQVNHMNGDKQDNRLSNLEVVTGSENCKHAHRTGLAHGAQPGEAHHAARLTEATVIEIRRRVAAGEPQIKVAEDLGLDRRRVNSIVLRHTWATAA